MELIGKILNNRYEIIEKIGTGGMATVYKAKDQILNRFVAVKVLKDEFAADQEFIKRFQIEAQSAASLSHPNIVSIYDVSNEDNIHYIVMELISGKTLKQLINEKGKLTWQDSIEIASQIAAGLSAAHKNHIIHRDIKPHNIILTKDLYVKITDFGIAKATSTSTINASSNAMGSVHYFSPEHARGGYTDEKSDLYSLGVVLYEMVTGKLPFDDDNPVKVAMKHLNEAPVPPIELEPTMPKGLNDIILKLLQKEVGLRYSSAVELYKDLQKVLNDPKAKDVGIATTKDDTKFVTTRIPKISTINGTTIKAQKYPDAEKSKEEKKVKTTSKSDDSEYEEKKTEDSDAKKAIKKILKYFLLLILVLVLGIVLAFVGISVINGKSIISFGSGDSEMVEVPTLKGNSLEVATQMLEDVGLSINVKSAEEGSSLPKNYVVKQGTPAGEKVKRGKTIDVVVSAGTSKVSVPEVKDMSKEAARSIIEIDELVCEVVEESSDTVADGYVIRQSPDAKTTAYQGDKVTIYVSTGPDKDKVEVPDVMSMTLDEAKQTLEALGFEVDVTYLELPTEENGKIQDVSPEAGSRVAKNSTINIVVIQNEEEVPDEIDENTDDDSQETPVVPSTSANYSTSTKPSTSTATSTATSTQVATEKYITIDLSTKGSRSTFVLKVEINGDYKGRKLIYEATHSRSDGTIKIPYPADATGMLRVYIDDVLESEQYLQ